MSQQGLLHIKLTRSVQSTFTHRLPAHGYTILITALQLRAQTAMLSLIQFHIAFYNCPEITEITCDYICKILWYARQHGTYEELPLPSRWPWSPKTRCRSVRHTNNHVIFKRWNPVCADTSWSYPVVIGGIRILVAGDDFRSHPIWGADESVSTSNSPVQLSAHSKINWRYAKTKA